jgi:hypothetical protein
MTTLTRQDMSMLAEELSIAIEKFSNRRIPSNHAQKIAEIAVRNVDFNNSTLAHKGINWFAKDLLKKIRY